MSCHICRDSNIQQLIDIVFNALLEYEDKARKDFKDFDFIMDVDEQYNGGHGIWVRLNAKYYYVTVEQAETDKEILDDLFSEYDCE
jgi:hypothetical protein